MITRLKSYVPPILGGNLSFRSAVPTFYPIGTSVGDVAGAKSFIDLLGITSWNDVSKENTAYYLKTCPPLATIINRKAQAFINGKLEVLNANTDNYIQGKNKRWSELLSKPNPLQTERQFRAQLYSYMQAYGYCPVLIVRPAGFTDYSQISQLWIIPPPFIEVETNDKYLYTSSIKDQINSIKLKVNNTVSPLNKEDIYFFTEIGTNITNIAFPDSKLVPLKYPINNIIKNYEARGTIAEKRGAIGILSNSRADNISTLPLTETEKRDLQADYSRYGMNKDQWQLIITNASLNYQSMTMPVRDMMLLEMEKADVMAIADAFNYPSVLLASEKGTTYSNQADARRGMYQDAIVPESMNIDEQYNDMLHAKENGIKICYDFTWLPILQEDEKLKAEVRRVMGTAVIQEFDNNIITFNRMRELLGEDTIGGMDKFKYELPQLNTPTDGQKNTGVATESNANTI